MVQRAGFVRNPERETNAERYTLNAEPITL